MCQSRLGIKTPLLLSLPLNKHTRAHSDKYTVCVLWGKLQHWRDKFTHEAAHSRGGNVKIKVFPAKKQNKKKNTQTSASPVHTCTQKQVFLRNNTLKKQEKKTTKFSLLYSLSARRSGSLLERVPVFVLARGHVHECVVSALVCVG